MSWQDFQLSVAAASFTSLFQTLPLTLTTLVLAAVAQAVGFRVIMLTGVLLLGAGALLINDKSWMCLIAELFVTGLAMGAESATVPRLVEDVATRYFEDPIGSSKLLDFVFQIANALGPVIGSLLVHLDGLRTMGRAFGVLLIAFASIHTLD